MVNCMRCGALNPEGSLNCSNCGAPLVAQKAETRPYNRYAQYQPYDNTKRSRDRSALGLLIMGLFIVILGSASMRGSIQFWPIVLILIGVWVFILGLQRSRKNRQPLTH